MPIAANTASPAISVRMRACEREKNGTRIAWKEEQSLFIARCFFFTDDIRAIGKDLEGLIEAQGTPTGYSSRGFGHTLSSFPGTREEVI